MNFKWRKKNREKEIEIEIERRRKFLIYFNIQKNKYI